MKSGQAAVGGKFQRFWLSKTLFCVDFFTIHQLVSAYKSPAFFTQSL